MKVLILPSKEAAILRAADIVAAQVRARSDCTLGLATGGTMLPLYAELAKRHQAGEFSMTGVTSFNLDEYVGLAADHPGSYHRYMAEALFDLTDMPIMRAHLPRGDAIDPKAEAMDYEARIAKAGGIDLQLLGIGQNGHIGFNEPTSSLGSRTRIKTLTDSTLEANRRYFDTDEEVPKYAITMGIATILEARACLLLALGESKAEAAAAMIEGPVSAMCPASALQMHAQTTVILDEAAASRLKLTDYYHHVHPGGRESDYS
ncbi:glucosamine-6-phosphate deaminase [Gymnodinialimonas ceratoperidinii]|uniref:Glucosamine-6-phosphate deaminase n=1 Tax=Gymnodinialimonas ceratoperidinii TaxID=2856823 RepID=A0A8F6TX14_9RHOB|nr:glucosamine-6-phosphate deaminase [Gymnodinialimonas ceratoperidinii]QXT39498.1 glucosamine-6-phosphate deaminase [Gymnodinialimonas ceratoperidinii]